MIWWYIMYITEWRKWCWRDIKPQWRSLTCKNIAQGKSSRLTNIKLCVLLCAVWEVLMVTWHTGQCMNCCGNGESQKYLRD